MFELNLSKPNIDAKDFYVNINECVPQLMFALTIPVI